MARHLCNRFIWFIDIAALVREFHDQIDFEWVNGELEHLQLKNVSGAISQFCNTYIDKNFSILQMGDHGWNTHFQKKITSTSQILSQISIFHDKGWRANFSYLLSPGRFFIITDPSNHSPFKNATASRWIASYLMHIFQLKNRHVFKGLKGILQLLGYPLSFAIAAISIAGAVQETPLHFGTGIEIK